MNIYFKYGTIKSPGKSCFDILMKRSESSLPDGIYWISLERENSKMTHNLLWHYFAHQLAFINSKLYQNKFHEKYITDNKCAGHQKRQQKFIYNQLSYVVRASHAQKLESVLQFENNFFFFLEIFN